MIFKAVAVIFLLLSQGQQAIEVKPLTGDFKTQLKELRDSAEDALKEKAFYESQVEKAELKLGQLRAKKDALFARFCAKNGLDPDDYEWTSDLTGVRKKAIQPAAKESSKEPQTSTPTKPK